ncbi:MAG: hypothetical protein JO108_10010 [Acidobacteriaceae bacterium]|nr:hypothetical protein [Acidobacteriaceae bacterium]
MLWTKTVTTKRTTVTVTGKMRPLTKPPRCRGVPVGNPFTGWAYGYGDLPPLTGPCDCQVGNGPGEYAVQPN